MYHLKRITDETVGLILAFGILLAHLNRLESLELGLLASLIFFFLLRLTLGKPHIKNNHKSK